MIPIDVIVITKESHPALFAAFETVSHDKGTFAGHLNYAIPMSEVRVTRLDDIEMTLAAFKKERPKLFELLCIGEETQAKTIVKDFNLQPADELLQRFFEDFS